MITRPQLRETFD